MGFRFSFERNLIDDEWNGKHIALLGLLATKASSSTLKKTSKREKRRHQATFQSIVLKELAG